MPQKHLITEGFIENILSALSARVIPYQNRTLLSTGGIRRIIIPPVSVSKNTTCETAILPSQMLLLIMKSSSTITTLHKVF